MDSVWMRIFGIGALLSTAGLAALVLGAAWCLTADGEAWAFIQSCRSIVLGAASVTIVCACGTCIICLLD